MPNWLQVAVFVLTFAHNNADTCVKQVRFSDVVGMVSFDEHYAANTEACVVDCTRNPQCKAVLVRALAAGGQVCVFYSRAATSNELRFLGDGAPVSYIELLDMCPSPNMITSLADVAESNGQSVQNNVRRDEQQAQDMLVPLAGMGQVAMSPWSDWTECTSECGGGQQMRQRKCLSCQMSQVVIQSEVASCNVQPCDGTKRRGLNAAAMYPGGTGGVAYPAPMPAPAPYPAPAPMPTYRPPIQPGGYGGPTSAWQQWGNWGACSSTCGQGQYGRVRRCYPSQGQCPGEAQQYQTCSMPCPTYGPWGPWSGCAASCGQGYQTRTRTCSHGSLCQGSSVEQQQCQGAPCAQWGTWSGWGSCSNTCGQGTCVRTRPCQYGNNCQQVYGNSNQESQTCYAGPCPAPAPMPAPAPCYNCGGGGGGGSGSYINGNSIQILMQRRYGSG